MLDPRFVRKNPEIVEEALKKRGVGVTLGEFQKVDLKWRGLIQEVENLKNQRNRVSQEVAQRKKAKEDAGDLIAEMRVVSRQIRELDNEVKGLEEQLQEILLEIPNIPHASVPWGRDDSDNELIRTWGELPPFAFAPKPHWDIGEDLGILSFSQGAKITGSRFTVYHGLGARLERAVINFMLDLHTGEHGYEEVFPPFIVNSDSMMGTGQLPKFGADMFKLEGLDYYLIPTAEVPVTNLHREEILDGDLLPIYYAAYSGCFRSEAGAAGRDTRGLIRQHQFNKVELVKFTRPEDSYEELEKLTRNAEKVLQLLELPYRVVNLSTGDLGFSSAKTYDLEVWLPSYQDYMEISSCSNFEDFQARRARIRYRAHPKARAEFVHTLNGSGLAVGRTVAAILENYQQEDGTVAIPKVLQPYMDGAEFIGK
ncbi:MAG: serine--tRNA ligase [Firmicutes bacterium]|nr:serine--tRNA ligase [Bacillota bacterium]